MVSRSAKGTQMTTTHGISYALAPASPVLGAEVDGIDLANPVDEATAAALRQDFWRYKVLVFRNQHLPPARARRIGANLRRTVRPSDVATS